MALFKERLIKLKNEKVICLRPVQMFEAQALLDLMTEVAQSAPFILSTPESFRRITIEHEEAWIQKHNSDDRSFLIAADDKDKLVGILNFQCFRDEKRFHRGALGLSIAESDRGQGLGEAMLKFLLQLCEGVLGLDHIELSVMDSNESALGLYKKLGFYEVSRVPDSFIVEGKRVGEIFMRLKNKPQRVI